MAVTLVVVWPGDRGRVRAGLSKQQRAAITKEMAARYRVGSKAQKTAMLDELCALSGWTRVMRAERWG